jgi:signal peptidase I
MLSGTTDSEPTGLSPALDAAIATALEVWAEDERQHWLPVVGDSMMPLMREGDAVLVAHGEGRLHRGTIVVFRKGDRLLAHRVLRTTHGAGGRALTTKGDNRLGFDAPVLAGDVVGHVVSIQRGARKIRIDTPGWQVTGWCIAVASLALARPLHWGRAVKRWLG